MKELIPLFLLYIECFNSQRQVRGWVFGKTIDQYYRYNYIAGIREQL